MQNFVWDNTELLDVSPVLLNQLVTPLAFDYFARYL